jgi:uncharacterized protein (TIGR02284 family)
MGMAVKDLRALLNDLIQTCKDGQQGFLDAAHYVKDESLRSLFLEMSQQRALFGGELQQEVMRLKGDPETSGSTMGALHRGWIDFKARIAGQSDMSVIKEVERGEDAAAKAYQKTLQEQLPGNLREVIERQYDSLLKAHACVCALGEKTTTGSAR